MSHVARAVTLLAQAVEASGSAQAACSTADEHARVMRDAYIPIAEDSGHDAPNAASRHVLDAQEALTEITNRLHDAAEALRTYAQRIAPGLAGSLQLDSMYRPTGAELLELEPPSEKGGRRARLGRKMSALQGDVADAGKSVGKQLSAAEQGFRSLPDPPASTQAAARQPTGDPIPEARPAPTTTGWDGVFSVTLAAATVVVAAKEARKGLQRMWRSATRDNRDP